MNGFTLAGLEETLKAVQRLPDYFIDISVPGGETKVVAVTLPPEHKDWQLPGYARGTLLAQMPLFAALQRETMKLQADRGEVPPEVPTAARFNMAIVVVTLGEAARAYLEVLRIIKNIPEGPLFRQTLPVEMRPLPPLNPLYESYPFRHRVARPSIEEENPHGNEG